MELLSVEAAISLLSLTAMEIVLGIDNIVFISIIVARLPEGRRKAIRQTGIALALVMRLGLLASLSWIMGLTRPLLSVLGHEIAGRHIILLGGGLFLIGKATLEIYDKVERGEDDPDAALSASPSATSVLIQILLLDIVFSLDSVITAVGMAPHLAVMVTAMVLSVIVMLIAAGAVGEFIQRHPSMKILALSFLLLIGVLLTAEGMGRHVEKGYVYFAMAFSFAIELVNMRFRKKARHRVAE